QGKPMLAEMAGLSEMAGLEDAA
ncbi:MAG: hypothetical protein QOI36_3225, partial [Pseudonocardiales bacterium]|nr:hypothetical protein [Pseudonocardiales bacterium]